MGKHPPDDYFGNYPNKRKIEGSFRFTAGVTLLMRIQERNEIIIILVFSKCM